MKNRPLCTMCLVILLLIILVIEAGGLEYEEELQTSALKQKVLTGQVYQKEIKENYQILYLKNNSVTKSKILIYDDSKQNIALGNYLQVTGTVGSFDVARNPGNFDQKFYYQKQGINACMWATDIQIMDSEEWMFRNALWEFRRKWREMLTEVMGEEKGSILAAMLLGDKTGMDAGTKELYQANGIGHILAISGVCFLCWVFLIGERLA